MSREVVKQIIWFANEDETFLQAVLEDPDTVLKDYDLAEKERNFFRYTDRKTLEGLTSGCFELMENRRIAKVEVG